MLLFMYCQCQMSSNIYLIYLSFVQPDPLNYAVLCRKSFSLLINPLTAARQIYPALQLYCSCTPHAGNTPKHVLMPSASNILYLAQCLSRRTFDMFCAVA